MDSGLPRRRDVPLPPEAVLIDPRPLVVLAGIGAVAWLQGPVGENNAERRRNDFRYTPDPALVRVAAGAHKSTTADLMWLRTLPDMSREFADAKAKSRWLGHSLDAITDLEPSFMTVYDFGQAYLTVLDRANRGSTTAAIALLEKGIRENPDSSGLHVRLAMVHYMERRDRAKTVELLRKASVLPGFDSLSAGMLSSLLAEQRDDIVAIGYWADLVEHGSAEVKRVAVLNLWRTKSEIAKRAAKEYETLNGRKPSTPGDLRDPKLIQEQVIPVVLDGLEIRDGAPRYPRGLQAELDENARHAEILCRAFHDETGRWPTMDDLAQRGSRMPKPPAGKRWLFEEGRVTLVAE